MFGGSDSINSSSYWRQSYKRFVQMKRIAEFSLLGVIEYGIKNETQAA